MRQLIQAVLHAATVQHAGFDPLQQSDHGTVELPHLASVCSGLWAVGSAQDLQHTLTSMPQAPLLSGMKHLLSGMSMMSHA